jgi:L-serine dehydratase
MLDAVAQSIGGGALVFTRLGEWNVHLTGDAHETLVELNPQVEPQVIRMLGENTGMLGEPEITQIKDKGLLHTRHYKMVDAEILEGIATIPGVAKVWNTPPVVFTVRGEPLFSSAVEMIALADRENQSLGRIALAYESELLGLSEGDILSEMVERLEVMRAAVKRGLDEDVPPMQLLQPSARNIYQAEAQGRLPTGGLHTRAAARAMAVMHVNGGMGVVCAAPTAGSAGVIPGVVVTLMEELGLSEEQAACALLAASAIGLVIAKRATFAAEVAGCQVEIGASGAMAAAAVVEAANGSARQAADAAAIALQNTMGSICDPVQGVVEIPCHTRNAVGASSAFVCADIVLGGYQNPIPLDETVDTMYAVGKMLPHQLKCTALGGLAQAPSALALPRRNL